MVDITDDLLWIVGDCGMEGGVFGLGFLGSAPFVFCVDCVCQFFVSLFCFFTIAYFSSVILVLIPLHYVKRYPLF